MNNVCVKKRKKYFIFVINLYSISLLTVYCNMGPSLLWRAQGRNLPPATLISWNNFSRFPANVTMGLPFKISILYVSLLLLRFHAYVTFGGRIWLVKRDLPSNTMFCKGLELTRIWIFSIQFLLITWLWIFTIENPDGICLNYWSLTEIRRANRPEDYYNKETNVSCCSDPI